MLILVMFGFNLNKHTSIDITDKIEDSLSGNITTDGIEKNIINEIGIKVDDVIVSCKDKLFEKIMQLVG